MHAFLCGLTGYIVTPFNPIYDQARQNYNRAIQQFPLIIVYCRNNRDVSNAVQWSRRHCVPLRIRSGGHNYEGYSNGNCTLIIDISKMNKMDECSNKLYVQGGVNNEQVYDFVSSKNYPFPGGTCPTVGVSGYTLGGGWGLSCRLFGLGCDSLEEIELVNFNGAIIKASRRCHPDLFWACRGAGGGNFGVIVSMTFKLPPKINKVTLVEIDYLDVGSDAQKKFLGIWQEWLKTADVRMTLLSRVYNSASDGLSMLIRGIFYGEPEEAEEILSPFLKLQDAQSNIESMTFLEAVTIIGSTYPPSEKFASFSRYVSREFSEAEISNIVDLITDRASGSLFAGISMYALGGRVAQIGIDDTAFFYRKAHYIIWMDTIWEEKQYAAANREWISKRFPYLNAITNGSYVNFPYSKLPCYLYEYYGAHAFILMRIKAKYDPLGVFSYPQGLSHYECHLNSAPVDNVYSFDDTKEDTEHQRNRNPRGFRYVSKKIGY